MHKQISKTKGIKNMKKLMTVAVASAVAFLAIGAVNGDPALPTGTSFEERDCTNLTWNALVGRADDGVSIGNLYWYASPSDFTEEMGVISNYNGDAYAGTRPDKFAAATQNNFLSIETSTPLFRTVYPYNGEGGTQQVAIATGEGLYLDTLVKFTAADAAFGTNSLDNADKIAISYVAYEPEHPEDVNDVAYTNFVICAGYIGANEISQTNYLATITNGTVDLADWHRLTVRTLTNIDGHGRVGFKIYVDEKELVYLTDDARFATAAGAEFADATRTIFPSVIDTDKNNYNTISSVAFSGNGSIDDLSFTSTTPQFIKNTESVVATINLGPGISGVTVSVSGTPVEPADSAANPLVFNLAPGTTDFTLDVTADAANGYTFDDATGITAENASYANGTVTISGGAPTLTLKAIRNNVNYIDGDNNPTSCVSLATAFANAKSGTTITLAYGLDANAVEGNAFAGYQITGKTVTLDLNGNSIIAVDKKEEALFTINPGAKLIVIDSSSANTGTIDYDTEYAVFYADGECEVGATTGDYGPKIVGPLVDPADDSAVKVIRGKLDGDGNSTAGAFNRNDYVDDNSEVSSALVDGFWVVAPKGSGDEDWKDPSEITKDATAGDTYGITGDLAAADALELTEWATGVGSVTFANKDTINIDCFLLNIANNSTAAQIQDEKDEFVVNISFDSVTGEPVVTAPTGKTYNGKLIIKGSDDLSIPKANWDEQTDGDTFFYGVLSL